MTLDKLTDKRILALTNEIDVINSIHCRRVRDFKRRKLTKLVLEVVGRYDRLSAILKGLYDER